MDGGGGAFRHRDGWRSSGQFSLGPSHTRRRSVGFSSGVSAAIQDSVAPPGVRGLWHSAVRSNLRHRTSETCDAWNRGDPIFDARHLVLTNQSKSKESYSGLKSKH